MDRVTLQSELASQQATYDGAKAEYEYQKKNYERSKGLHEKSLISDTDFEQALYNYQKAKSSYDSSKASLAKAERNLSYATITRLSTELYSAVMWKPDRRRFRDSRLLPCSLSLRT